MPMGTLTGYATPAVAFPTIDHTYVISSHGHVWGCWGANVGGGQICTGNANTDQAHCLSQPSCQAGIVYSITGVCHQTANRILVHTGQTVSRARGYRQSFFVWGTYGLDLATLRHFSPSSYPWPQLQACVANHRHP